MAQGRDDKFGAMLRGFRKKLNLSQFTLAVEAGLSARTICDLERGINQPRPYSLDQIADALELTEEERAKLKAAVRRRGNGAKNDILDESAETTLIAFSPRTVLPDPSLMII